MVKRKDGRWQETITITKDGETIKKYFYGKTKAEVAKKMAAYQQKQEAGRTFATVADEWDTYHSEIVTHNAHVVYNVPYRMAVDRFGDTPIREITPPQIQQYIKQIAAKGYARRTVAGHLTLLNMIFDFGVVSGDLLTNPTASVAIPRGLKTTPRTVPDNSDIQKIKDSLHLPFGLFAYLLLYTGLRRGEALALTYEDIDRAAGVIHVNKAVYFDVNQPALKDTKTKAGTRTVPLLAPLEAALPCNEHGPIFCTTDGKLLTQTVFRRRWVAYQKATGIQSTPHQLRHLYATILFEAGVEDKTTQEIMGHSSIATTRAIYTHIREQKLTETTNKLNSYFRANV